MTNRADVDCADVASYPTDPANPGARLPYLAQHPTGYEVIATGVICLSDGYHLCCLINVSPSPWPKFIFHRAGVGNLAHVSADPYAGYADSTDRGARVVCKDNGNDAGDGWVILDMQDLVGFMARNELHVGPADNRGMRVVTSQGSIVIDPIDPQHVTLTFKGLDLQFEPDMIDMPSELLRELLYLIEQFISEDGPDSKYGSIESVLESTYDLLIRNPGDTRKVPAWCLDLIRLYLSRCDEPHDGYRLSRDDSDEAIHPYDETIIGPFWRLVEHMRQILEAQSR